MNIADMRVKAGITQQLLALKAGVTRQMISAEDVLAEDYVVGI